MTETQLYLAIGVPMLANATLILVVIAYINAKISGLEGSVNQRFDSMDRRFDDMKDLWRTELRRVEEVLDARLKHIEEERT